MISRDGPGDNSYQGDDGYGSAYDYEQEEEYGSDDDDDVPVYGGNVGHSYGSAESYGPSPTRSYGRRGYAASYGGRRSSYGGRSRGGYGVASYDDGYDSYDNEDSYDDGYGSYDDEDYGYAPRRRSYGGRRGGRGRMERYGRSGTYGYAKPRKHVPVIIKKKKEKKRKIISVHQGFYVPGGTAIFGKFKDLKSCEKACELTPTCFSGDFNPWLSKCYIHANLTACMSMRAHKQITHFKKVPCTVVETPRGKITLGAAVWNGLEQKGVDNLMDCVKKCASAGGGVAATPELAASTPQLCFGIDYDFSDHSCYFHTNIAVCGGNADANAIPYNPVQQHPKSSSVSIQICPKTT